LVLFFPYPELHSTKELYKAHLRIRYQLLKSIPARKTGCKSIAGFARLMKSWILMRVLVEIAELIQLSHPSALFPISESLCLRPDGKCFGK